MAVGESADEPLCRSLAGSCVDQHMRDEAAIGRRPVTELQQQRPQTPLRRLRLVDRRSQTLEQRRVPVFDQLRDERVTRSEVIDETAEIDAGLLADAAHREQTQPGAARLPGTDAQQALAGGHGASRTRACAIYTTVQGAAQASK